MFQRMQMFEGFFRRWFVASFTHTCLVNKDGQQIVSKVNPLKSPNAFNVFSPFIHI